MAQKSNPISLRLRKTNKLWNSCWYGDYNYTKQLLQDRGVEAHIQNICQQAKMASPVVFLNRQRQQTSTFFFFSRQQRIGRIKRPSRAEFQKSARGGYNWLHKLLFWSCKVPVHTPRAVTNNWPSLPSATQAKGTPKRPLLPFAPYAALNKTATSGDLHFSPPMSSSELPTLRYLFPYLLVSQVACAAQPHNCENYGSNKETQPPLPSSSTFRLSPDQPATHGLCCALPTPSPKEIVYADEITRQGESRGYALGPYASLGRDGLKHCHSILSTWKKPNDQNRVVTKSFNEKATPHPPWGKQDVTPTPGSGRFSSGKALASPTPGTCPATVGYLLKTCQQDWGFFAMRNQYFTGAKITARASYPGGFSRPAFPGRVQQRGYPPLLRTERGKSVNVAYASLPSPSSYARKALNVASPWRNHLESCISAQTHHNSTLHFLLCPSVHQNPLFLATQLCSSLENRKTFRRLKDRLMQDISTDSSVKGIRITCSGRVAARSKKAQKAKTESIQWGQTSLNVFSDLVNFASKSALTPFGKIGVKVWICYREIKK